MIQNSASIKKAQRGIGATAKGKHRVVVILPDASQIVCRKTARFSYSD